MSIETEKWISEYFKARPQLDPPPYNNLHGYALPAPCLHMIESLIEQQRTASTEGAHRRWIPMQEQEPPDSSGFTIRSMYLMCNDGFVTIGFWYSDKKWWADTVGRDVTSQVSHWKRLPDAPNAVSSIQTEPSDG